MYLKGPIKDFLDKLASSSPEPGGGAASALVAATGAALVSMVCNLTLGKEKYAEVQDKISEILTESESLRKEFEDLVQKDTEVYGAFAKAMKMPRTTPEEKAKREEALKKALREATQVPMAIAWKCVRLAELSGIVAEIGNVNAVSDAGVAAVLADAAAQCAAFNVKINLSSIDDKSFASEKWSEILDILSRTKGLSQRAVDVSYGKL